MLGLHLNRGENCSFCSCCEDGNQTGDLTMDEFCDMIVKMKAGP